MFRVVFAACAAVLLTGSVSWLVAARSTDRRLRRMERQGMDTHRLRGLVTRDLLVAVLVALVGIAALAEAIEGGMSAADWFLGAAVVPTAALLPYVRRYQGAVEVAQEIYDERERTRLELLYEVAAAGESLSIDESAERLGRALVPLLGDWGIVALLDIHGAIDALAVSRSGDEPADLLVEQMLQQYPVELDIDEGLGLAIRSGEGVLYDDINDELLASVAQDPDHLAMLRELGMNQAAIEPLIARGHRIGAVAVITKQGRTLDEHSLSLLADVAEQAAPVLGNALLHRELTETDRALRFSEAVMRAQGESGVEGLLVVSPEGKMISYNSRFAEMWGLDPEIIETGSDEDALAAAMERVVDPDAFIERVREMYADPVAPSRDEVHFVDGRVFDRYGAPLRLDDGSYLGWAWYFRDITDERMTQQSLLESGERFAGLARTLQESLLPPDLPDIVGAQVAARYHPAGDGSEIGGDFYDVFQVDESDWCAVMGDVCGKGAAAARLTALARYTSRAAATRSGKIEQNLRDLNAALVRQAERDRPRNEHRFATMSMIRFRPDGDGVSVRAGSGGHPAPLVVRADGTVEPIDCQGSLLGVFEDARFRPGEARLGVGDAVVLYTDGVTEARRGGEEFGEDRLAELLRSMAGRSAVDIAAALEDEVLGFQEGTARDDIAILVVRAVDTGVHLD